MLKVFYSKLEVWMLSDEYKKYLKEEKKQTDSLNKFLNKFSLEFIRQMDIDDYVLGKDSQKRGTFCYYFEYVLGIYGATSGRTTAPQKYGIHWDNEQKKYSFGGKKVKNTKFGSDPSTIFENIKKSLISLINDTIANNQDGIIKNILNPQFKNKVSFLYSTNTQIPIYSDDDLNLILPALNIPFSVNADRFIKRQKLYNFYLDNGLNEIISPLMFMLFIYSYFGYRNLLRSKEKLTFNRKTSAFVKELELVDIILVEKEDTLDHVTSNIKRTKGKKYNPDNDEKKRITGKKAEQLVIEYLNTHKAELQIDGDIKAWCDEDDSKGYDISYKQLDGKEVFVEVKGVSSDVKNRIFFEISANQRKVMDENPENYYIFFISNVDSPTHIKRILAKNIKEDNFEPIKFRVNVKTKSVAG